ncbi:hypothetical protein AURDEDRAFT_168528 [Auricularia subglabra TFB-10046 SS5]|nr:hypothetical protein AURDEDRAFT_168528 [Auricularia subglabra TFB-10046 SS5]
MPPRPTPPPPTLRGVRVPCKDDGLPILLAVWDSRLQEYPYATCYIIPRPRRCGGPWVRKVFRYNRPADGTTWLLVSYYFEYPKGTRLGTVAAALSALQPVAQIAAFPPRDAGGPAPASPEPSEVQQDDSWAYAPPPSPPAPSPVVTAGLSLFAPPSAPYSPGGSSVSHRQSASPVAETAARRSLVLHGPLVNRFAPSDAHAATRSVEDERVLALFR